MANEINTLTCGVATQCSTPVVGTCSTTRCSCNSNPCQCGTGACITSAPTPFYNQAGGVQENHNTTVIQQSFIASIATNSSFNVPACDENATITLPGLQKIQIGSYLWSAFYGYFQVISFDYVSNQVVIKNVCIAKCDGSAYASPGTLVPACSLFNVTDPPCSSNGGGQFGIFLAIDFVAPANGNCIDIAVTEVAGLVLGQNVQISSGIYRVSAIIDSSTITICNDGDGVVPGTIVVAKDSNNQFITPITPLSTNACTNPETVSGALLVCHNNVQSPLSGPVVGQVPVLIDTTTNEVQFQTLAIPVEVCTLIDADITLVIGTITYTVLVADSTIFTLGDVVVIHFGVYESDRWVVTILPDPTHVTIQKTTTQTINDVIPSGSQICIAPCCDQLTVALDTTNTNVTNNTAAISAINNAFVFASYVPLVSATGGTMSAVTASGRYVTIGKLVIAYIQIAFTSGGANNIMSVIATLPFTSVTVAPAGVHKNIGSALLLDPAGINYTNVAFVIPGVESSVIINNQGDINYAAGAQTLTATITYEKV